MGKKLLAFFLIITSFTTYAQTRPGSLRGTVTDTKGETVPFANIVIKDNAGNIVAGGTSDIDGGYNINPVAPGTYNVEVSFTGYATIKLGGIQIAPNVATVQNFKLREATEQLQEVEIVYQKPLIDPTGGSKTSIGGEELTEMAIRGIGAAASQVAGVTQDAAGNLNIRGARDEGTQYYINGVKMRGNVNVPQAAIQSTEVITGGVPAQYGDAVGGIVNTTTKGPSPEYFGSAEILTSYPFDFKLFSDRPIDPQNYNLAAFTVGGPLPVWKDSDGKSRIGFLLATEVEYVEEPTPAILPYGQVDPDTLESIRQRPITIDSSGTSYINRTELVTNESISDVWVRPESGRTEVRLNGSLQIKTSRTTNVSIGSVWEYNDGRTASYSNHLFNYQSNLQQTVSNWSSYVRFQQTFPNTDETSLLKNAYYTIQLDYSRNNNKRYNKELGDDFFRYGHVGNFEIQTAPRYVLGQDSITGITAWRYVNEDDTNIVFTPGNSNPILSNYMSTYFDLAENNPGLNTSDFDVFQSSSTPPVNGQDPLSVYNGLWGNAGAVQGFSSLGITNGRADYLLSRNSQFRITASTSFDVKDHSLILGFEYEQRTDRAYALDASGLWERMRLLQNQPIQDLDLSNPLFVLADGRVVSYSELGPNDVFQDTILYNRAYSPNDASAFAENIREALGKDKFSTDRINIDNLDPSVFSLDMFSADELINPNGEKFVGYYGYDYTGELLNYQPSIADFFLDQDENGRFTRPVGAFQPIYIAGYIQDQFTFRDLTFNVGVRVDRFDLNQQVLRDPYILYPFYTVEDLSNPTVSSYLSEEAKNIPASIGSDYRVYVNSYDYSSGEVKIVGYRNGDNWYNAQGQQITDPSILSDIAGGGIKPFTVNTPDERINIENERGGKFLPEESFADYEPQTVVMPRVAFNFPITDEAIFIAHYDILAQRPTTGLSRLDPFDYLNLMNSRNSGVLNNPDLRPQRTTEYEIGFRQVLSENTALQISAFYREMRDLIQTVAFTEAYPITYVAYGNRDFGTVKGFTMQYEMRRTNNFRMNANYTLQFANGTGSSSTSGLNLARAGQPNLRYILPLNFDNRHAIYVGLDYRYGKGSQYNGPVWWDKKVFERFGVNLTMNAQSGSPYTRRDKPYIITTPNPSSVASVEGQVNGSRLPWQVTFDARINKIFSVGKESSNQSFEVYLQILNLFNTSNVVDVYNFTGSPVDDGYLVSPDAQALLAEQTSVKAYTDLYNRAVNNPFNYSLPRRLRIGLVYNF